MINKELQKTILSSIFLIPVSFFFIIQGSLTFIFFLCFFQFARHQEIHEHPSFLFLKKGQAKEDKLVAKSIKSFIFLNI